MFECATIRVYIAVLYETSTQITTRLTQQSQKVKRQLEKEENDQWKRETSTFEAQVQIRARYLTPATVKDHLYDCGP